MDTVILHKENLNEFLKSLGDIRLVAPVAENGKTRFEVVEDVDKAVIVLDDYTASPKKVMFPQTETLFSFKNSGAGFDTAAGTHPPVTVVFGIRPCDAKAFTVLDPLFSQDKEDPYYKEKRESTILVGNACTEPTNRCFCPSVGGSPGSTEGLDVLLTDIGDEYHVEIVTDKGKELLKGSETVLLDAPKDKRKAKEEVVGRSLAKIRRQVDLKMMHEILPGVFEHDMWKEMAEKCIGCGICTYNCPTCHCFDIQDEGSTATGRRIRVWDACMYPEFTLHASGENPRPDRSARLRNRMMHKFTYYPTNMGHIGCVGCGRCIELCPVNIDLIEILTRVREVINE